MKEEQLLRKRLTELAENCYQREIPVYTEFLNLNEQTIFLSLVPALPPVKFKLTGGYEPAERKIVCFLPSYEEDPSELPIVILQIKPINKKFSDLLTHRDYLGAIMNLGIERNRIGDIVIQEQECLVLCMESMAHFLKEQLSTIKHTKVSCELVESTIEFINPKFEEISGSVASMRLDGILAMAFRTSRSKIVPYIEGEKVFINGKLIISNSYQLKEDDIISVRGLGKFAYCGVQSQTKKGRYFVTIHKYC